ncbi:MAG TPA: amidohydrolase family protein [Longimicrobiales bacterium]|nr:amidohydrolase family protein [Longimicrobiales bacterium]
MSRLHPMIARLHRNRFIARIARAGLGAAMAALLAPAAALHAQTTAITNARIHTISGPTIENGTIVIRNGRIAAVGADVEVPENARVIDGTGKVVTPGFLDASTSLGIVEIGGVSGTNDAATSNDRLTAAFNVADALNPRATAIPVTRVEGITRAVVVPGGFQSILRGQGVLIHLDGLRADEMIVRNPVGVYVTLGEAGAGRAGGSRAAAMLLLREALQDARDYASNRNAFQQGNRREYALSRLDLEALQPVLRREVPLIVTVNRASDIMNALHFARQENVRIILSGVEEGWMVADELASADVPVIINSMNNIPGFDNLGATLENAARLHAAGVTVMLSSFDGSNVRNLRQVAGNAVSYGLPHDAALAAVTQAPARVFGIADRYGTLEVGQDADVVVWSGDPFEFTTSADYVFIRGHEQIRDTRQQQLFERYRN